MRLVEALTHLAAAGIRLDVRGAALHASPRAALTDEARALIREHKPALLALLASPAASIEPAGPRRSWLVTMPTGERFVSHFAPFATLVEVAAWYPDALSIEVEPDPAPGSSLEPAALHLEATA